MKIYLCAAYERRNEMQGVAECLQAMFKHDITSSWVRTRPNKSGNLLSGLGAVDFAENTDYCGHFALQDLEDIRQADTIVAFTDGEKARGGRHVEFGYAAALGHRLILVGPRETLFHTLPYVEWFPSWPSLVMAMADENYEWPKAD